MSEVRWIGRVEVCDVDSLSSVLLGGVGRVRRLRFVPLLYRAPARAGPRSNGATTVADGAGARGDRQGSDRRTGVEARHLIATHCGHYGVEVRRVGGGGGCTTRRVSCTRGLSGGMVGVEGGDRDEVCGHCGVMLQRVLLLQWCGAVVGGPSHADCEAAGLGGDGHGQVARGGHLMQGGGSEAAVSDLRGVGR